MLDAARTGSRRVHDRLIDEVVEINMAVADTVASRYARRGLPAEDLRQVAYVALVRAAQRFDPERGKDFLAYLVPSVRGEIRRYFRDYGWMVRPPRRIQELQARIMTARKDLTDALGRAPEPAEVAARLQVSAEEIDEAMVGDGAFEPTSLDRPVGEGEATLGDLLGDDHDEHDPAEARIILAPLIDKLAERDKLIIELRFFHGRTQQEIADEIGVTQMQVSRLLSRIFRELREQITGHADATSLVD
ncbi:alternative sigma factor SigF [Marmoricola endophyticus]|uniref:Alternative sigma factor SigF n=2 Tax=Marmoricola endophyticus TaxID=2040280 RepID=A0A917F4C0_9ACTN|nr:alternative sigma factor SigF [Marmoricola endophyticus]